MIKIIKKVPLYPFLVALYPFLFFLSTNIDVVKPQESFRSLLIALSGSVIVFVFFLLILRDIQLAALYTLVIILFLFLVFFFIYAPLYRFLRQILIFDFELGRHRYLIPFFTLLFMVITVGVLSFRRRIPKKVMSRILEFGNFLTILLILIPISSILLDKIGSVLKKEEPLSLPPIDQIQHENLSKTPDIYYIILDMNTNENVLRKLFDYDDSGFTKGLEELGFFVTRCSQSNYDKTIFSLTSSLNFDFVQNLDFSSTKSDRSIGIQHSAIRRMLENAGYKTYAFETGYWYTELLDADYLIKPVSDALESLKYPGVNTYESLILSISAGQLLYENRDSLAKPIQAMIDAPYMRHRQVVLKILNTLPELPYEPGPKFVFAHVLAPHPPFVFDKNGNPAFRRTPYTVEKDPEFGPGYGFEAFKQPYVDEVTYIHNQMLEIVRKIIKNSKTPPIIIIQGDHGIPSLEDQGAQFQILNAYYFPGIPDPGFYDTLSPVNSFRLLLNAYFGGHYPLLPDYSFQTEETLILVKEPYPCQ